MPNNRSSEADFWDFTDHFHCFLLPRNSRRPVRYFFSTKAIQVFPHYITYAHAPANYTTYYSFYQFVQYFCNSLWSLKVRYQNKYKHKAFVVIISFSFPFFSFSFLKLGLSKFKEFHDRQCSIRKIQQQNFVFHTHSTHTHTRHSILISFCWFC